MPRYDVASDRLAQLSSTKYLVYLPYVVIFTKRNNIIYLCSYHSAEHQHLGKPAAGFNASMSAQAASCIILRYIRRAIPTSWTIQPIFSFSKLDVISRKRKIG